MSATRTEKALVRADAERAACLMREARTSAEDALKALACDWADLVAEDPKAARAEARRAIRRAKRLGVAVSPEWARRLS